MAGTPRWTLALLCALGLFGGARAQEPPPDAPFSCAGGRNLGPTASEVALAKIVGSGRSRFVKGIAGCPSTADRCQEKAYLVPGDNVLTGEVRGDYVCAMFPDNNDGHAGWLRRDRLQPVMTPPPLTAWDGDWVQEDNRITIRHGKGSLHADGEAYYPMADPPLEQFPGGPNLGAMGGEAQPTGHHAIFADEGCSVSAFLVGHFLVVSDNHQCGGHNVRFDGIYRRK